ncbi:hypothetical protein [Burkholderia reimsis]|uniref:hypothetical protein n=1 Tax=Burkholderia reimsis TaxID=2234132 RepID=UPI001FCBCF09|nr:hypothetical protein [Burkholderia reimsis]
MNLTPFVLPAVLTVVLIIMFVVGLRSLANINRTQPVPSSPDGASVSGRQAQHATSMSDELDEWEANAHWPEHDARPAFGNRDNLRDTPESFDRHAPPGAHDIDESRHELHEALRDESHGGSASFSAEPTPDDAALFPQSTPTSRSDATPRCPHCCSSRINTLHRARKAGSAIGSVAGATSGMAMALSGAEAGAVVGSFAGPVGTIFGGLAGAVIAGLVGSAAGCAAGSAVGTAIDENVLDNHLCLSCGHTFNAARS